MSLIQCAECGKEISDKAASCPHCGAPTQHGEVADKKARRARRGNIQGAGCLLMIIALVLGFTMVGAPFAILLGVAGVIILIVGLFS
ncbi:MAG: zinc ribbon domain-containing protein [Desulfobacterales bacterium]|nr:zinc ribbon domain-containing protein [Desulfobacterales bacterium]